MATPNIEIRVRKINPKVCILDIEGELTHFAEAALMDAYNAGVNRDTQQILLNFAGLKYMNSSGIGLLVTFLIRAQRSKCLLAAVALSDHYRQIFHVTRLDDAISIFATEADALAGVSRI